MSFAIQVGGFDDEEDREIEILAGCRKSRYP